ncbi:MAG: glycosyltransferase family 4 protein [Methylococcaceae bacterium]|nr:glycosyltransferase family 4 protein [Methylococcaceae bacterium]
MGTNTNTERLRIAVIIRHYSRIGGAERYCVELTERLAAQHEVHVFCQAIEMEQPVNITFHAISKWLDKPRYINQLLFSLWTRQATEGRFDIVHSHDMVTHADIYTLHVPCVLSRYTDSMGFKKILRYFNTLISPRMLVYLWLEKHQICPINNRQIIVVSEFLEKNILRNYPEIENNISIAYPGIQIKSTPETQLISRHKQRDLLGIAENELVILFVANDYKSKGLLVLLEAIKKINKTNLHLIVAGNDDPAKFTDLVTKLKLSQQVHFIGTCEDMNSLYPAADILVHPTLADTYAMVVLEAMAHGIPVVVSGAQYCGFSEHLSSNEALLIANPKDASEIAGHIKTLLADTDLRHRLAEKGRAKAASISWDDTMEQTLKAYNKALVCIKHA